MAGWIPIVRGGSRGIMARVRQLWWLQICPNRFSLKSHNFVRNTAPRNNVFKGSEVSRSKNHKEKITTETDYDEIIRFEPRSNKLISYFNVGTESSIIVRLIRGNLFICKLIPRIRLHFMRFRFSPKSWMFRSSLQFLRHFSNQSSKFRKLFMRLWNSTLSRETAFEISPGFPWTAKQKQVWNIVEIRSRVFWTLPYKVCPAKLKERAKNSLCMWLAVIKDQLSHYIWFTGT